METAGIFLSAVIAGFLIGTGGTVFLSVSNPVIGSFLFAVGLFTIVIFKFHLYTGKIGYLPFKKLSYIKELVLTWLGNLAGTFIAAAMIKSTRIYSSLEERVLNMVRVKLADSPLSLFILAVFCGALMFIAVDTFNHQTGSAVKIIAIFVPVMVFILSGFEHVIADMFYFSLAGSWSMHCLMMTFIMTLGNSMGGIAIPLFLKYFRNRAE